MKIREIKLNLQKQKPSGQTWDEAKWDEVGWDEMGKDRKK